MYAWEGKSFEDVTDLCRQRNPQRFTLGALTGNGAHACLQWFRDPKELIEFLSRMEPQRWGVTGLNLIQLKEALDDTVTAVHVFGLSKAYRMAFNRAAAPHFQIHWWGNHEAWQQLCESVGLEPNAAETPANAVEKLARQP